MRSRSRNALVVNLNLHGVGEPLHPLEDGEAEFWIGEDAFLSMLDEVAERRGVRLSFDDGNASDVAVALPALRERGLTATFFPIAGRLGEPGSLSPQDLRVLAREGMVIGSHGMRHRPWRGLPERARREEWIEAREVLAAAIGRPVDMAACPLGEYDRDVVLGLRRLGYRRVFTSDPRPTRAHTWLQPRFTMRRDTGVESLRRLLMAPGLEVRAWRSLKGYVKRWR